MGLLSYFKPSKGKAGAVEDKQIHTVPTELQPTVTSRHGDSQLSDDVCNAFARLRFETLGSYIYACQRQYLWINSNPQVDEDHDQGVVLKMGRDEFTSSPPYLKDIPNGFLSAIKQLNVRSAVTVQNEVIAMVLRTNRRNYIPISNNLRLQVLPSLAFLPTCQKHHFAAFIADRELLIVWDDDAQHVLQRAQGIMGDLMSTLWNSGSVTSANSYQEKKHISVSEHEVDSSSLGEDGLEAGAMAPEHRSVPLLQPMITALALALMIACVGLGLKQIVQEIGITHEYIRCALLVTVPFALFISLFFFISLSTGIFQLLGPIAQVKQNSRYYSGIPSPRLANGSSLPHVTIQMPVYKEGLQTVIEPTIMSLKAAISTYEMQGGTANIFINDDGMQLLPDEEAQARQDFYDENNIGWVARPKHNPKPAEGEEMFIRQGKFKKASNMNYAMWVSCRVEDKLAEVTRGASWSQMDEANAYTSALTQVVEEDQGRTWADGNVRFGDYILIIDSDTRVPTDCFLDAVSEMECSPQVAILQYTSGVMNVTDSYFEKGITYFTNLIYSQITYCIANGDVAPFVGHNAILRWSALQSIAFEDKETGQEKYWSENTVSEDFDLSLRLQAAGYYVRFGTYTGTKAGFEEGVSLTVYDELMRWEKYAYGCSELLFHPFKYWFKRGPFTPIFRQFLGSCMPFSSKVTVLAYIGTYYAIGCSWLLTLINYFAIGWFNGWLDHYYLDSFKIYISIIVVFSGLGLTGLAVMRYRSGEKGLLAAWFENMMWVPLMTVFFGGISMHVSQALVSHLIGIDMQWGATAKEASNTTFFEEIPKVLKSFKYTFAFTIGCAVMMIVMAHAVPEVWQIRSFIAIWPLATLVFGHFMLPIALNPGLMKFTF